MAANLLQNVYLFKGLSEQELNEISEIAESESFQAGDDVFNETDPAQALYIIRHGSVRIHQKSESGENNEVATLGTGSHFGEMAFVDGEKRSASATSIERSGIVLLRYQKLNELLDNNETIAVHFFKELSRFLCGRLRVTTNDLSFAREKNLSHF